MGTKALTAVLSIAISLVISSCAGYTLGGAKPKRYQSIRSIAVPQFSNDTLYPRLSVLATNSTVDALGQDGTYAIRDTSSADATLIASVAEVEYRQFRANRFDTLASDELTVRVHIKWRLVRNGQIIGSGIASGSTNFNTGDNVGLAKQNALPLATARTAQKIASSLSEGF